MAGLVALVLAFGLSACAGPTAPLTTTEDAIRVCAPADEDNYVAFGLGFVDNTASRTVVVNRVELVDPRNVELMGADVLDVQVSPPRGNDYERNPIGQQDYPVGPGVEASISGVVRILDPGQHGDTLGTRVHYTDANGARRSLLLDFRIIVVPANHECD